MRRIWTGDYEKSWSKILHPYLGVCHWIFLHVQAKTIRVPTLISQVIRGPTLAVHFALRLQLKRVKILVVAFSHMPGGRAWGMEQHRRVCDTKRLNTSMTFLWGCALDSIDILIRLQFVLQ